MFLLLKDAFWILQYHLQESLNLHGRTTFFFSLLASQKAFHELSSSMITFFIHDKSETLYSKPDTFVFN